MFCPFSVATPLSCRLLTVWPELTLIHIRNLQNLPQDLQTSGGKKTTVKVFGRVSASSPLPSALFFFFSLLSSSWCESVRSGLCEQDTQRLQVAVLQWVEVGSGGGGSHWGRGWRRVGAGGGGGQVGQVGRLSGTAEGNCQAPPAGLIRLLLGGGRKNNHFASSWEGKSALEWN